MDGVFHDGVNVPEFADERPNVSDRFPTLGANDIDKEVTDDGETD